MASNELKLLTAAFVAPMSQPIVREGAVVFSNGHIINVGDARAMKNAHPDATVEDLGNAVLIPGLVNAHTHLELSNVVRPVGAPGHIVDWIMKLMLQTARTGEALPDVIAAAVINGVTQCRKFGVTTVGDISKQAPLTRAVLCDGPLRVVSYGEVQAMAQRRVLLEERFAGASDCTHDSTTLRVGVTPHAPYSVEPSGYIRCLQFAREHKRPLATHLAENPEEGEFLSRHTGPFRRLWDMGVQAWDDRVPKFEGGPIRFADSIGLLAYPTLLAHANYCDDEELAILSRGRASVVYCPRTHAYFGHPPHRWRDMLAADINVAIGTDSCASSPDLNLVDDLRLVHQIAPNHSIEDLWQMVTTRAAKALQMQDAVGSLDIGKAADFAVFDVTSNDPLWEIVERPISPSQVWIAGKPLS